MLLRRVMIYGKNILCREKYLCHPFLGLERSLYKASPMQVSYLKTDCGFSTSNSLKESLMEIGLSENDFSKILSKFPDFDKIDVERVSLCIDSLMKCQFGKEPVVELLKRNPYIIFVDSKTIEDVFMSLSVKFTKDLVYQIFFTSPQVLNEPLSQILEKVNHLEERMFVSKRQIAKSGALSHPLGYIKLRHAFLERTGVFKKVSPKLEPHERQKINPMIGDILNYPDKEFSSKIAGVSIEEYEVFQELFDPHLEDDFS